MPNLRVHLPARAKSSYPVVYEPGLLATTPERLKKNPLGARYVVIADSTVAKLYGQSYDEQRTSPGRTSVQLVTAMRRAGLTTDLITFRAGERSKTQRTMQRLTAAMFELGVGRDGCILALGGGVTGDLAGFVAATYMRGIPLVHLPTTVVAMVDSAIGGKTGVDTPSGKNLIGAFEQPRAVWADVATLYTLPRRQRRAGMAEVVKHGVIADAKLFAQLECDADTLLTCPPDALTPIIARAAKVKIHVVERDEREHGRRQVLNFGHTLGHALELCTNYRMLHGEAVAIGMVWEARVAETVGVAKRGLAERIEALLGAIGFSLRIPKGVTPEQVMDATRLDKKARAKQIRYALPTRIGAMARGDGTYTLVVKPSVVKRALTTPLAQ